MIGGHDVIVVGGGVAGLTVAWRVLQQRPDLSVVVLESADCAGGRIRTDIVETDAGRFVIELGADSILTSKPWAQQLCRDLGIEDELMPVARAERPTAIWHDGRPVDLPDGLALLAPTNPDALRRSRLLSDAGVDRALAEESTPVREGDDDESLGSFVTRRFGREYLDAIAEPLLAGIYNANPDELSLQASFPQFRAMELRERSVIRGMQHAPRPAGSPAFVAFRDGIQRLPMVLAEKLGSVVRTGSRVVRIERSAGDGYRATLTTGEQLAARMLVVAAPLSEVRRLVPPVAPGIRDRLACMTTAVSGAIVMAWPEEQIARPLSGFGMVVPKREGQPFNAITVMSKKYAGRAPMGWSLMRFFFGGYRSPQTCALDDDALAQAARAFAATAVGARGAPSLIRIARWPEGNPIYHVGHLEHIAALEASLPPGLFVIGAPFRGPGIPDVVRSSTDLANQIAPSLVASAV